MVLVRSLAIILSSFLFSNEPSYAELLRSIDMDDAAAQIIPGPGIVNDPRGKPITTTVDVGTKFELWRSATAYRGTHGLAIGIAREARSSTVSQKSKIEINIARHDDNESLVLHSGGERWLGFAIRLDEQYEVPTRWVLHFQLWQCCAQLQPPLSLQVVPEPPRKDGRIKFVLMLRADKHAASPPTHDNGDKLRFSDGVDYVLLKRGHWYRMIVHLKPDPVGRGQVDFWIDGPRVVHYEGAFGYTSKAAADVRDTFAAKLGIYRAAQETKQLIYLDSIRWGTDYNSVNPDR